MNSKMYKNALNCAELLNDPIKSLEILERLDMLEGVKKMLEDSKLTFSNYTDVAAFFKNKTNA